MVYDLPKVPKIFLDASVLISAAISSTGSARALITRGLRGECELVVSEFVLEETERNLARKAPKAVPAFLLLRETLPLKTVSPSNHLVKEVAQAVELKDAPIVAGALKAQADYLVSYDRKHLLKQAGRIRDTFNVVVVTPDKVLKSDTTTY